jgi:Zn-dependent protease with chaperone function
MAAPYRVPMRRVRAVLGVLVLLAVPLVGVVISAALMGAGAAVLGLSGGADTGTNGGTVASGGGKLFVFLVALGLVMLAVTFAGLSRALRSTPVTAGVPLTRDRAPELWSIVDFVAARVGVPVPAEIRLIPEVNAAVAEQTRWLGLRRGHRVLLVGQPLLAGLSVGSMAAVIAHELGHLTNGDTSWGAFAKRGTVAIAHIRDSFESGSLQYRLYSGLLRLFFRISQSEQRRLEFGADRAAAMATGPAVLADVLRRTPGIDAAWQGFLARVEEVTGAAGALPPDLGAGFVAYLGEPSVQEFIAAIAQRPEERTDPLDSHPSTAQRLAALQGLPATDVRLDQRSALVLLDPNMVAEFYRSLVAAPEPGRPVADWPELITRGDAEIDLRAARSVLATAERLTGQPGATPRTVVSMVEQGHAAHLAGALSDAGGPVDVSPGSRGARLLAAALHSLARAAVTAAGGHRYVHHWPGPKVVAPDGSPLAVRAGPDDTYAVGVLRSVPQDFAPPPAARQPVGSR